MTSANERAVEAGARAYLDSIANPDLWEQISAQMRDSLRAAFPILAEELVAWHEDIARQYRKSEPDRLIGEDQSLCDPAATFHESAARALRDRIQQMAEETRDVIHLIQPLDWTMDRDGDASAYIPFGSYRVTYTEGRGWRWGYCFSEYYDDDDFGSCRKAGMDAAWANWVERVSPIIAFPAPPTVAKE